MQGGGKGSVQRRATRVRKVHKEGRYKADGMGLFFGGSFAFPHTDVAEGLGEGEGEVCESEEGEGREGGRLGMPVQVQWGGSFFSKKENYKVQTSRPT